MSKTSNRQKLECLRIWSESRKFKAKKKVKKQPQWLKDLSIDEDAN